MIEYITNNTQETMQNTQNNFTVENLVAKYRNYVAKNCPKHKELLEDEDGRLHDVEVPNSSEDFQPDEQLLVTMYKRVAGRNVDVRFLNALSRYAEKFYSGALSAEEFSFLCSNFKEAVSFIKEQNNFQSGYEPVPQEVMDIIQENAIVKKGSAVFIADAGIGDIPSLFAGCKIKGYTSKRCSEPKEEYFEEVWAISQIRLYSQGISSNIHVCEDGCPEVTYLDDVDCIVWGTAFHSSYNDAVAVYQAAKPGTQMILFMNERDAAGMGGDTYDIRRFLVEDCAIRSIISFEYEDRLFGTNIKIAVLAEKSAHNTVHIKNNITGACFDVPSSCLDPEILWPSFYGTKRPKSGIPFSEIVTFVDLTERIVIIRSDGSWVLPEKVKQMPVAVPAKMAKDYKDANLLMQDLDFAGSQVFDEQLKFLISALKEPCVLVYGNKGKTVVGYIRELPKSGITTLAPIVCLIPKDGIDVRYIAALLLSSEVKGQLESICQGSINHSSFPLVMSKVIVPNHSDKERLEFLLEENYEALQTSQKEREHELSSYTRAIRMRKHALTQSLSSIEAVFYALNSYREKHGILNDGDTISRVKKTTVREAFGFISQGLKNIMPALEYIAEVEYSFEKPEWIDPEKFIEDYIQKNEKGWLHFKPVVVWKQGHNQAAEDLKDPVSGDIIIGKGDSLNLFLFPKDALERIFNNIISNAKAHGFGDKSHNDYQVRFSWHMDGMSLTIEIENNGSPIPSDRDVASLLEYGVSTNLHCDGHNGIGCNEIEDIMKRYDGKVEIVSSPESDFPVKYILTFNRSNNIGLLKF